MCLDDGVVYDVAIIINKNHLDTFLCRIGSECCIIISCCLLIDFSHFTLIWYFTHTILLMLRFVDWLLYSNLFECVFLSLQCWFLFISLQKENNSTKT